MFRKAEPKDLEAIAAIYDRIHDNEEAGKTTIGWIRSIYPTRATAQSSIEIGDMYVEEVDGVVVAASFSGKLKTVMQMVSIIYMLAFRQAIRLSVVRQFLGNAGVLWGSRIGMAFIWISVIATVVSGIQYIWQLRHYFKETND